MLKKKISIFNSLFLLFFLGNPTAVAAAKAESSDESNGSTARGSIVESDQVASELDTSNPSEQCKWVLSIWQKMGGSDIIVDSSNSSSCCYYLGSTTQSSGITGVRCRTDGSVTEIIWRNIDLTGSIPFEIGNLVNLEKL
jgi:hypothetical protein